MLAHILEVLNGPLLYLHELIQPNMQQYLMYTLNDSIGVCLDVEIEITHLADLIVRAQARKGDHCHVLCACGFDGFGYIG